MPIAIKKMLAYFLMILGTLVLAFFKYYHGTVIPVPWLWSVTGLILFFSGVVMYVNSRKTNASSGNNISAINELINSGEKINVDFQNCKVVSTESVKSAPEHEDAAVLLAGRTLNAIDNAMDDGQPIGSTL